MCVAGSRSTSPTSLQGYITYTQLPVESTTACAAASGISRPRSCIPRSRGQSRDTSPTRRGACVHSFFINFSMGVSGGYQSNQEVENHS